MNQKYINSHEYMNKLNKFKKTKHKLKRRNIIPQELKFICKF